jgi:uncharacterized 2Fe-2S/4Fe-4S cluster protein (DUF4445 family)
MRAAAGAIDAVHPADGGYTVRVIGDAAARGICGSGLVDAIAAALQQSGVRPNGRLAGGAPICLAAGVSITQGDIRELQLAKGAIAAGLRLLSRELGTSPGRLWLAGAFGNSIHVPAARGIGLLPEDIEITPVGNSALRGTRALLLQPATRSQRLERLLSLCRHVELASLPGFADDYAEAMGLSPFQLAGM